MKNVIKKTYLIATILLATIVSCNSDDDATSINLQNLEVTIDENPTNGQVIGSVQSNSSNALTYSITTQTPAGALSINASTGELTVLDESLFDFEVNPTITATVSATGASNSATVTVNLNNLGEVTIQNFTAMIDENPTNGQSLGTVSANGDGVLTYAIVTQSPAGALSINSTTGVLTVLDATLFDYETNPTITASVQVDNSGTIENGTVTIELEDKNEIGEYKFGGVIFWVNAAGNEGYAVAITDQSTGVEWGCYGVNIANAVATSLGTGEANTLAIITSCTTTGIAADLANNSMNGNNDWFLPSLDELNEIYLNKTILNTTISANGGTPFGNNWYWTSTQQNGNANNAYFQYFGTGMQTLNAKSNMTSVRSVRHWTDF